ncbi:MAG: GNAT family N-acetyltransferase [Actinomycetes bacterium]
MEDLLVRQAQLDDAQQIALVHVETWQNSYLGLIPDSYLQSLSVPQREETWKKKLEAETSATHTLVAEIAGTVIGFIDVGASRDGDSPENQGEIYAIYVDQDKQGFGIGTQLLNQAMAFLKGSGFTSVALWVLAENSSSRLWYETRGWHADGHVKSEHRGNFDLIEVRYVRHL